MKGVKMSGFKVKLEKNEVLILKTNMMIHPQETERIRADLVRQSKAGIITIPNGFEYEIVQVEEEK